MSSSGDEYDVDSAGRRANQERPALHVYKDVYKLPQESAGVVKPSAPHAEIVDERRLAAFVRELTAVGLRAISRLRRERPELAEDLVSDALLRLWKKYGETFAQRELHRLAREMVRTVRNLAVNEYEAMAARKKHQDSLALRGVGPPATPLDDYEFEELLHEYERAVAEMEEDLRLIWLAHVDGRKSPDIAAQYGLSVGAVEKRRQRADAFIRPRIEAAGYRWLPRSSNTAKNQRKSNGSTDERNKGKKVAEPPPPRYNATGRTPAEEEEQ